MDRSTALKAALIGALALALLVPVAMIRDLISEHQARRNEAVGGIALGWGQRQVLAGALLLFGLLAGLMPATRRVDWYRLTRTAPAPGVTRRAPS